MRGLNIVLGVDQATSSGWSIHAGMRPIASGVVNVWEWQAREAVIAEARALSGVRPFVFAYEDHAACPLSSYKSTGQVLALGGALWLWFDSLRRIGHPESMSLGIASRDWRYRVLGVSERMGRKALKAEAVRWAQAHTGKANLGDDEADACAVSAYGAVHGAWEAQRRRAKVLP